MRWSAEPITARLAIALTAAMGVLLLAEQSPELQRLFEPTNIGLSRATEGVLHYLKMPVARQDAVLTHPDGFSYRITYVCSGFRPAVLIIVTLLTIPATCLLRLSGLIVAIVGMQVLNLCRLVHLYWVGVMDPDAFFVAHRITWNIIAIVAVVGFLALWLGLNSRSRPVGRQRRQAAYALP